MSDPHHHGAGRPISADIAPDGTAGRRTIDPRQLLLFVHIPKTGGTSFVNMLRKVYGPHFLHVRRKNAPGWRWPLGCYSQRAADEIFAASSGHRPYGFHRLFGSAFNRLRPGGRGVFDGRDLRYITVMREPIATLSSLYRFVTTTPSHQLYERARHMRPIEFLTFMPGRNSQSGLIGAGCSDDLDAVKERIVRDFHAVGLLEDIDPFINHLATSLGWPEGFILPHVNKGRKAESEATFDDECLEWIGKNHARDIALYDFVRRDGRSYWKS